MKILKMQNSPLWNFFLWSLIYPKWHYVDRSRSTFHSRDQCFILYECDNIFFITGENSVVTSLEPVYGPKAGGMIGSKRKWIGIVCVILCSAQPIIMLNIKFPLLLDVSDNLQQFFFRSSSEHHINAIFVDP